jgi:hypothetical protein
MKILVKFPTRGRKDKFFGTLMKYQRMCNNIDNLKFLISIDSDDQSMNNKETFEILETFRNVNVILGLSKSKIDAVNRDIDSEDDWDIILLASDDMIPIVKGYDDIIIENMKKFYHDTDGVLFFNDGFQKNKLNTLCILGKKYYKRFNYIYHPEYKSTWCDNEFMDVANILQKQTYFDQIIIKHEHPDWGYGKSDIIHQKNYQNWNYDKLLYEKRKKLNFEL